MTTSAETTLRPHILLWLLEVIRMEGLDPDDILAETLDNLANRVSAAGSESLSKRTIRLTLRAEVLEADGGLALDVHKIPLAVEQACVIPFGDYGF